MGSDNTQVNPAVAPGGSAIRTLDKTGAGAPKTELAALDLGGGAGRPELIASLPVPIAWADAPVDDDGALVCSLSAASLDALEILFRQLMAVAGRNV